MQIDSADFSSELIVDVIKHQKRHRILNHAENAL